MQYSACDISPTKLPSPVPPPSAALVRPLGGLGKPGRDGDRPVAVASRGGLPALWERASKSCHHLRSGVAASEAGGREREKAKGRRSTAFFGV